MKPEHQLALTVILCAALITAAVMLRDASITGLTAEDATNQPPVWTGNTTFVTPQDTQLVIDLNAFFTDPEGQSLTFIATEEANLTIDLQVDILTITPDPGFVGERIISAIASDGEAITTQYVKIAVSGAAALPMPLVPGDAPEPSQESQPATPEAGRTIALNAEIKDESGKNVGKKIADEAHYETYFTFIGNEQQSLIVRFYHDAPTALPVWVEGGVGAVLSTTVAQPYEEVLLSVPLADGNVPFFRLHVGAESDVFEFGTQEFSTQALVNGCAEINESTSLSANVVAAIPSTSTCISIKASHVVFNCTGFNITGNGTAGFAIRAENLTNVTIRDCRVLNFSDSNIRLERMTDSFVLNNTIVFTSSNAGVGIRISNGTNFTVIANNTINSTNTAMLVTFRSMNNIVMSNNFSSDTREVFVVNQVSTDNNLTNNLATSITNTGMSIAASNNTVTNNTAFSSSGSGISVSAAGTSGNLFVNNTGMSDTSLGLSMGSGSNNNRFSNNSFIGGGSGIGFVQSSNSNFTMTTVRHNGSPTSTAAISWSTFGENNSFSNTTIISNSTWLKDTTNSIGNNFTNTTFASGNGSILILPTFLFINRTVFQSKLNITFNNAFLNSTNLTFLNTSAVITLREITSTDPKPTVDFNDDGTFEDCASTICTEISFSGNVFVYNVSQFTSYSSADVPAITLANITACGVTVNSSANIVQNIQATGGICINVTSSNAVINCSGFTITGNGSGTGIKLTGLNNVTINGCIIANFSTAVFVDPSNLTIENSTFENASIGLNVFNTTFSIIRHNIFRNNTVALLINISERNNFTNSTFQNNSISIHIQDFLNNTFNDTFVPAFFVIQNTSATDGATINYSQSVNITTATTLSDIMTLSLNRTFVNSSAAPAFNRSALVTLRSITFSDPKAVVDFEDDGTFTDCPASICTEISFTNNVFVFNVTQFTTYSSSEAAITSCPVTINSTTSLTQNIPVNTSGNCITIGANNIILNCSGFSIGGNASGTGINASLVTNVTIKDCIVENFSVGIALVATNFSLMTNNTARNHTLRGILVISNSLSNRLTNNTGTSNPGTGIYLLFTSTNNTLIDNIGIGVNGITLDTDNDNNTLIQNNGSGTTGDGIQLSNNKNNQLTGNVGRGAVNGISFSFSASNTTLINNVFEGNGTSGRGINLATGAHNNTFVNTTLLTNATWILVSTASDNNITNTTFEQPNGSVRILPNVSLPATATINLARLNISSNKAFLNSTNLTFFNTSAEITLRNITFNDPQPTVDFQDDGTFATCPSTICTELGFNSTTQVFLYNVTQFTSFSSSDAAPNISSCPITINESTTLTQNLSSNGTCILVNASNLELDCNGFTITYGIAGSGVGITGSNNRNITIRDCIVIDINASGSKGFGMNFTNLNGSLIANNTITTNGTSSNNGIDLTASQNTTITNNTVRTFGSASTNDGISVDGSENNITRNTITTNGTGGATGGSDGIVLGGNNNRAIGNTIINATHGIGIFVPSGNGHVVANNSINSTIVGIRIEPSITSIFTNNITTGGDGIIIANSGPTLHNLTGNIITAFSTTGSARGIVIIGTKTTNITGNIIVTNGTEGSTGILLNASSNNFIFGNVISANGTNNSHGIGLFGSSNNTFIANNITTSGVQGFAIFINISNTSLFNQTVISDPEAWINSSVASLTNFSNITFEMPNGSINILPLVQVNGSQEVTKARLNISSNNAFLNSTNLTFFNRSAIITLRNITFSDPRPTVDFEDDGTFADCASTICTELSFTNNVFVYNVTQFTSYSSAETSAVNITACPITINTSANLVQNLTTNLNNTQVCIEFGADNIALSCNNSELIGNRSGIGMRAANHTNITVQHCRVQNFSQNILFEGTNSSFVLNTTTRNASGSALELHRSNRNLVANVTARNIIPTAFNISASHNNTVLDANTSAINGVGLLINSGSRENLLRNINGTTSTNSGIELTLVTNNTLINVRGEAGAGGGVGIIVSSSNLSVFLNATGISVSSFGFRTASALGSILTNITATSQSSNGIRIDGLSKNNRYSEVTAQSTTGTAIHIQSATNNNFSNVTSSGPIGILIEGTAQNSTFRNTTLVSNSTWLIASDAGSSANNFTTTTFNGTNGSIKILLNFTLPGTTNISIRKLNVTFNNAFLNSTNLTFLNQSGEITLRDINFTDPKPTVDFNDDGAFEDCASTICTELSFTGNVFVYNVTQFTSYSSVETSANITSCPVTINVSTNLTQNLTSNDTCITMGADNITLDCKGFSIFYNANGSDSEFGVVASGRTNVTVKNCIIRDINATGAFGIGINLTSTTDSVVTNTSVFTNGTNDNYGILLHLSSQRNNLTNNTIQAGGSANFNTGIYLLSSDTNNEVTANVIQTTGTSSNIGLFLSFSSSTNRIENNTITANGTSNSDGVRFDSSSNGNVVVNNTITTDGSSSDNYGIELLASVSNNKFIRNSVSAGGTSNSHGVRINSGSNNNTFENTNITTRATAAGGIGAAIDIIDSNSSLFNQTTLTRPVSWINTSANTLSNFTNTTFEQPNGSINTPRLIQINGPQDVTTAKLNISFNNAFLNSSNLTFLNTTGIITLRDLTFTDPFATVDFDDDGVFNACPSTICTELSYTSGIFVYNVSQFTSYSSSEGNPNITLVKISSPDPVIRSTQLNYTITINNTDTANASNISLTETYPNQTIFISSQPTAVAGTNNTFIIGNLSSGQFFLVNITVFVRNLSNGTVINNTVNISFTNLSNVLVNQTANTSTTVVFPTIASCPAVINTSAFIVQNLLSNGSCLTLNATNILVQCFGTSITGNSTGTGIKINTNNVTVSGCTVTNFSTNVKADPVGLLIENSAFDNANIGLELVTTNDSQIRHSIFRNNSIAILLNDSLRNNFTNNTIRTSGIVISLQNVSENNSFLNTSINTNATWLFSSADSTFNNFTNTTFEGENGSINILRNFTLPALANVSIQKLNTTFNKAFLNSTNLTFLNTSAEITLLNLTFTNPFVTVDFNDDGVFDQCPASICTKLSFIGGALFFNVTQFTSYSSSEGNPNITLVKISSPNPVFISSQLNYTITINNTDTANASNISLTETYPNETIFISSQPTAVAGTNNTFIIGNLSSGQYFLVNITVFVRNLSNGTVINNTVNISFTNFSGVIVNQSANTSTTVIFPNISSCPATINTSAFIVQNLLSNGSCITFGSSNSVLSCLGFSIGGNTTGIGINATDLRNITIKDCFVENFSKNILLSRTNDSFVSNSTARNSSGPSVVFETGRNSLLANSTAQSATQAAINLSGGNNNTLTKNNGTSGSHSGLLLTDQTGNNTLIGNRGTSTSFYGVLLDAQSNNNTLINTTGASSSLGGVRFSGSSNNTFLTTVGASDGQQSLRFDSASLNNTLSNTTLFSNVTWIFTDATSEGNKLRNTTFEGENGSIDIVSEVFVPATTTASLAKLNISFNNAFLNSSNLTFLNTTGIITLNGLTFTDPFAIFDIEDDGTFLTCSFCTELSYTGGVFVYNTSHFTSYSSSEGNPNITLVKISSPDPVIRSTQLNYTITINNTDTANASNISLTETYPNQTIFISSQPTAVAGTNNTFIVGNLSSGQFFLVNITVFVRNLSNGTVINNSVNISFTNLSNVLVNQTANTSTTVVFPTIASCPAVINTSAFIVQNLLSNGSCLTLNATNILVQCFGTSIIGNGTGTGIKINTNNVTLAGCTVTNFSTNTKADPDALIIENSLFENATIGIDLFNTTNSTVRNNTFRNTIIALFLNTSLSNNFTNNTIASSGIGIDIEDSSENNSFLNTNISTNATWIFASDDSAFNNFTNTTFEGENGSIHILRNFTLPASANVSIQKLNVTFNRAFLNSSNLTFLNTTGIITLRNILPPDATVLVNFLDGGASVPCLPPQCTVLSFSNNVIVFNVSSFTFYSTSGLNISVTKNATPDPVNASSLLNYTITINVTAGNASNVTVNETYPEEVIFQSSQPPALAGTNNTFIVGNLTAGTVFLVNVSVLVRNITNGTVINNTANVSFQNATGILLNLSATANVTVLNPPRVNTSNLSMNKTDDPDPVNASSNLTYRINVTSNGNATAFNTTVNDTYPSEVIFLTAQPTPLAGTNNTFILGNVTNGTSILINITVLVRNITNGTIINNTVNATFHNETSHTLSIIATQNTTVLNPPFFNTSNISVNKTDTPDPVTAGAQLNYNITVRSTGNTTAFNVTVNDTYPSNVTFVSAQPSPVSGTDNFFILGNLTAGTNITINITVSVNSATLDGTVINNSVNVTFQNETSNVLSVTASASTTVSNPPISGGSAGRGGGGGAGVRRARTYLMTRDNQTFTLLREDKVVFNLGNVEHAITLLDIVPFHAVLRVESTEQRLRVPQGATQVADVDGDGRPDVRLTVVTMTSLDIVLRIELLTASCLENWACEAWSPCVDGTQTRLCVDINRCRTTALQPATQRACTPPVPVREQPAPLPPEPPEARAVPQPQIAGPQAPGWAERSASWLAQARESISGLFRNGTLCMILPIAIDGALITLAVLLLIELMLFGLTLRRKAVRVLMDCILVAVLAMFIIQYVRCGEFALIQYVAFAVLALIIILTHIVEDISSRRKTKPQSPKPATPLIVAKAVPDLAKARSTGHQVEQVLDEFETALNGSRQRPVPQPKAPVKPVVPVQRPVKPARQDIPKPAPKAKPASKAVKPAKISEKKEMTKVSKDLTRAYRRERETERTIARFKKALKKSR